MLGNLKYIIIPALRMNDVSTDKAPFKTGHTTHKPHTPTHKHTHSNTKTHAHIHTHSHTNRHTKRHTKKIKIYQ